MIADIVTRLIKIGRTFNICDIRLRYLRFCQSRDYIYIPQLRGKLWYFNITGVERCRFPKISSSYEFPS